MGVVDDGAGVVAAGGESFIPDMETLPDGPPLARILDPYLPSLARLRRSADRVEVAAHLEQRRYDPLTSRDRRRTIERIPHRNASEIERRAPLLKTDRIPLH